MTREKLNEILSNSSLDEVVKGLKVSSYPNLPKWADLVKEYNPKQHNITNPILYPPKLNQNNVDDFKRTALPLQKLAVKRISQAMFSTPVTRKYNYADVSDASEKARTILEELYRTINKIDSENIERAKKLNASCQICTIWNTSEKQIIIEGETSKLKLVHRTYSPKDGYELYPINDIDGELMVMSIGFKDTDNVEWLYTYVRGEKEQKSQSLIFKKVDNWELDTERSNNALEVFPVVYTKLEEPVWADGTPLVEQLEEMESYQGLYIKRNALPTFTLDYGEIDNGVRSNIEEDDGDSRRIIEIGRGGGMNDVTWEGAEKAITGRYDRLRNAFFEQAQLPDNSFNTMIKSNTSAENKELVLVDVKARARDLGGEWESLFFDEIEIVKTFASIMFPRYKNEFASMSVRSIINPYSIKTKKENAEYVSTASGSMSLKTKIAILNEVDDVDDEADRIIEEQSAQSNQIL